MCTTSTALLLVNFAKATKAIRFYNRIQSAVPGAQRGGSQMASSDKVVIFGPAYPLNLTPVWVANDKGFFREEGLDVELRPTPGIPDSEHPRHDWRKDGMVVFQSPGGSPPFRSVREEREPIDQEINVVSIANHTAHVFVARPDIEDPSQLKGKRLGCDSKGGS